MMNWREWMRSANASIYSCHFLSSWSGRMWGFSMGLFLISLSPTSLQLSATYGLSMGAAILTFGSILGNWVDKTPRLKAAIVSMIFQNLLITICACVVFTLIMLLSETEEIADWLRHLFYAIIIILSVCSRLMKEARIIVVERDWIVEMCAKDEHHLAVMTSSFRRIDLSTKLLAPIVTGQILTFAGLKIGCGFIVVCSLVSLGIEYYLIRRVYNIVPALRSVKNKMGVPGEYNKTMEAKPDEDAFLETYDSSNKTVQCKQKEQMEHARTENRRTTRSCNIVWTVVSSFRIPYRGLQIYFSSVVKWPGMALACLYLTVLGFDDITVGYATMQGVSGSVLGIMMGVGAGFGILATFTYPFIVRKLNLPNTGVLALALQVTCLTFCVISVWLPGSPFDLFTSHTVQDNNGTFINCSAGLHNTTRQNVDGTDVVMSDYISNVTLCFGDVSHPDKVSRMSVSVLIAGIVLARFGLWTADLTTVQLFLENVAPTQRGIVNGFQSSLNQLMDFLKYALVVFIPHPHQFGLLVFISYAFICTGWMLMGVNAVKATKRRRMAKHRNTGPKIWKGTEEMKTDR